MRADRLISIMLLLQTQKRISARELASRLEVSERTIHRDMEALSTAGIPVLAERGMHGGWSLLEPYQTNLTGLNEAEIRALFLTTPVQLLTDLGLRQAYEAALIKLQAALPAVQQKDAKDVRQRILMDIPGWRPSSEAKEGSGCFPMIQSAVLNDLCLRIAYQRADGTTVEREVDPLGLVAKGKLWYLIAAAEGEIRTYRVSRVQNALCLDRSVTRPPGFDLAQYWAESSAEFVANLPRYLVRLRLHKDWVDYARANWRYARIERLDPPDAEGWCCVAVNFETLEEAAGNVLVCGPFVQVLEPEELKGTVRDWAAKVSAIYS
jgi:predicted DNA-binding transcriptional regulator YafY